MSSVGGDLGKAEKCYRMTLVCNAVMEDALAKSIEMDG